MATPEVSTDLEMTVMDSVSVAINSKVAINSSSQDTRVDISKAQDISKVDTNKADTNNLVDSSKVDIIKNRTNYDLDSQNNRKLVFAREIIENDCDWIFCAKE